MNEIETANSYYRWLKDIQEKYEKGESVMAEMTCGFSRHKVNGQD